LKFFENLHLDSKPILTHNNNFLEELKSNIDTYSNAIFPEKADPDYNKKTLEAKSIKEANSELLDQFTAILPHEEPKSKNKEET
jgi:hypothetical protein